MSFSSEIKTRSSQLENTCEFCNRAQLAAMIRYCGRIKENCVMLATESKATAKSMQDLIGKNTGIKIEYEYIKKSRLYEIIITDIQAIEEICDLLMLFEDDYTVVAPNECCKNAYVRGAFLGGGSVCDPKKSYHMEFDSRFSAEADRLCKMLNDSGINAKITERKGHFIVYIKDYSGIADVLGMIGDSKSALEIYNISVEKDLRNSINRQMNCESANMDKVADAYKKHLAAIEKIKRTVGLSSLPETLQQIARVRLMYPEDSLKALGQRLEPPIGKSGVNHRLNRIVELAGLEK